jgi:5-(carboxyamino)imidazole ribonucleotide synthase
MNRQIAIIGNGQLAQMMHDESASLGLDTTDFPLPEIEKDGTCKDSEIKYWVHKLRDFDCVTFEIENIPVRLLKEVQNYVPVYPAVEALSVSQDRLNEKQLFNHQYILEFYSNLT